MIVSQFLAELRTRDIEVRADGDRLRCTAPTGVLTGELRDELLRRKGEILAFLHDAEALTRQQRAIVPLQPRGLRTPVFAVGGHNGDVFCYRALCRQLGDEQPFFGLQPPGVDGQREPLTRVEDLAAYFADQIGAFRPSGPYIIAGFCAGGSVAFELARQLLSAGATVSLVALFGSPYPTWYRFPAQLAWFLSQQAARIARHVRALGALSTAERCRYLAETVRPRRERRDNPSDAGLDPVLAARARLERTTIAAVRRYTPGRLAGRVGLFVPSRTWLPSSGRLWRSVAERGEEYFGLEGCTNDTMLLEPHALHFAALFRRCCDAQVPDGVRESAPRSSGPSRAAFAQRF